MKSSEGRIIHTAQERYITGLEPPRDALLAKLEAHAETRGQPISDPEVAAFLAITIAAQKPRMLLELGTNIGYGAIVMARAAGEGARVLTVEYSPELVALARTHVQEAGLETSIEVREGKALEVTHSLADESVDFAYIDCVKEEYPAYLEALVPKLSARGVIVADNVLWRGLVANRSEGVPASEETRVSALHAFNEAVTHHPKLRGVILPLGDGVAFAVKAS